MQALLGIAALLLSFDAGLIGGILISKFLLFPTASASLLELGPFLIAAGVLTALITFIANSVRSRSEDLLEAANDLLERAYEKLAPTGDSKYPNNSRYSWLSAARLIATAERLATGLTESSHCQIYEEKKEYWRTRLYELIFPSSDGLPSSFYAEKPEHMIGYSEGEDVRDPLSEKSMAFLYRFIQWPKGVSDPLANVAIFTDEEIEHMRTFGPHELGKFLVEVRRLQRGSEQ